MFRLWVKLRRNNKTVSDMVAERDAIGFDEYTEEGTYNERKMNRTIDGLDEICSKLDIERPIWLDNNTEEFLRRNKTRFNSDNFMDAEMGFDFMEIAIIEE